MAQDTEEKRDNIADSKQTAQSDSGGTAKVSQAMSTPPKHKSKLLTWLMIIIILLAIILAGLLGWLWWRDRDQSANQGTPTGQNDSPQEEISGEPIEEAACADGFTTYTNADLGVQFCYPTTWGEPSVSDAKFAAADTGSRWLISFASNSAVHAGLVTSDWTTAVGRDGTCVDPAVQTMPTVEAFSTEWIVEATEGDGTTSSALRGVQSSGSTLLINEYVDSLLSNGVCLNGYKAIDNELYPVVAASYFVEFNGTVANPQQHVDNSEVLIPAESREDFATFVESIEALEE